MRMAPGAIDKPCYQRYWAAQDRRVPALPTTASQCWPSGSSVLALRRAKRQTTRYARRTPQNSGNAALTMSLMSDRNAVGWNNCPSGMQGKVSSART
jgi:hypothetical protein